MMQRVYSVFDRKAVNFGALMFFVNDEMAKRGCADLMRAGGDVPMVVYPDDFDVYCVGEFDTDTGVMAGFDEKILVCRFADYKPRHVFSSPSTDEFVNGHAGDGMPASAFEEML